MKAGWTISAVLHGVVLAWGLIAFATRPLSAPPPEFLTTDIISSADFSQITQGIRTAPKAETPKPLVEKVGEDKPVENPTAKVVDKPEIVPTADQVQPQPTPEPKKAEPKPPTPQPQPKPEPKQAFTKEPEPKIDPIAEAIKKQAKQDKKQDKKAETQKPEKKAEPPKPQPKYDATRIAALLDKRDPQRRAATGEHARQHALARNRDRPRRHPDAKRARRAARAAASVLERARRPRRGARPDRDRPYPVQAGRQPARRAAADEQRQPSGVPGRVRKRAARRTQLCALYLPSRREVRGVEGCHRRF